MSFEILFGPVAKDRNDIELVVDLLDERCCRVYCRKNGFGTEFSTAGNDELVAFVKSEHQKTVLSDNTRKPKTVKAAKLVPVETEAGTKTGNA